MLASTCALTGKTSLVPALTRVVEGQEQRGQESFQGHLETVL